MSLFCPCELPDRRAEVGDTDVQARWYLRLKNEWILSQQERRPFRNPIQPRTLHWRS